MILTNGYVMDENFRLVKKDVEIKNGIISAIGENLCGDEKTDMTGKYILPGFVDTHIHGAYGERINDTTDYLSKCCSFEATQGVTSVAITTDSSSYEGLLEQMRTAVEASKRKNGTKIAAIHAEGPFLNPKFKGAMSEKNIISPDKDKLCGLIEASCGLLKIMTVAPEMCGCIEFIKYAVGKGIKISMGHTDATFDVANEAIKAGATRLTHTFNAMRPINHREPGVLVASLLNKDVMCEVICDYVHLHPATVQMIYKLKGADGFCMVSDSGTAAGLDITEFEVHGVKRYVKDKVVRLADGTIAGSAMTLADGVKNLINSGIPIEDVSKMASYNPAKGMGMEDKIGSIKVGKLADIAVLDENYNVAYTFVDGECVFKK